MGNASNEVHWTLKNIQYSNDVAIVEDSLFNVLVKVLQLKRRPFSLIKV